MAREEYAGLAGFFTGLAGGLERERRQDLINRQQWMDCVMAGNSPDACSRMLGYEPPSTERAGAEGIFGERRAAAAQKEAGELLGKGIETGMPAEEAMAGVTGAMEGGMAPRAKFLEAIQRRKTAQEKAREMKEYPEAYPSILGVEMKPERRGFLPEWVKAGKPGRFPEYVTGKEREAELTGKEEVAFVTARGRKTAEAGFPSTGGLTDRERYEQIMAKVDEGKSLTSAETTIREKYEGTRISLGNLVSALNAASNPMLGGDPYGGRANALRKMIAQKLGASEEEIAVFEQYDSMEKFKSAFKEDATKFGFTEDKLGMQRVKNLAELYYDELWGED